MLKEKLSSYFKLSFSVVVLGLASGAGAVSFMILVNFIYSHTILNFSLRSPVYFALASLIVVAISSLTAGILLKFSLMAAGSGIPEVKAAYWKEMGHIDLKAGIIKYIAGAITIGGGTSLGREGPSVFLGSAIATNLACLFGVPHRWLRGPNVIGAAAGLSAAFNAPLASVAFLVEEILGDLNSRHLGSILLAAVAGAFVTHAIIGKHPAFIMPYLEETSWNLYLLVPLVAFACAGVGVFFQRSLLFLRAKLRTFKNIPLWIRPLIGGMSTWFIGTLTFVSTGKLGVFSLGYQDLSDALHGNFPWEVAGLLVLGKFIATCVSYASGGCGGIFAPTLFFGGMTGFFLAGLFSQWIPLGISDITVLTAVGMATCLGAVVRAPLTSLLIVFEMTHQFELVPGLLFGTFISQIVARLGGPLNLYEALLIQDGHELHKIKPPLDLRSWQNLPVSAIANYKPVVAHSLEKEELKNLIENYPYTYFPLMEKTQVIGILNRENIDNYLNEKEDIKVLPPVFCYEDETLRDVGNRFVESPTTLLLVKRRSDDKFVGLITLHDLIRAQISIED